MTCHHPFPSSASDGLKRISLAARPIRIITQIWVVKRQQYDIGQLKQQRFWATHVNRKWAFFLFKCLNATIFVWLSGFTLTETICPKVCSKSRPKSAKSPLPVDVRITALVPQLSFREETSSGVANSSVFSDLSAQGKYAAGITSINQAIPNLWSNGNLTKLRRQRRGKD